MNTLRIFTLKDFSIPASTSWYLADLGEFRGKQALYTQQSPQRLKTLREHALIESAVSSNRIEGFKKRAGTKSSSMKSFRQVDSQLKNTQKRIESNLSWEAKATMHLCTMKRGLKSIESR